MLEQISQLVKQYGQDVVVNNPDVPNEANNQVMAEATTTITSGMQNLMAGGGLENIISMFTQGGSNSEGKTGGIAGLLKNPVVTMMVGHLISKLTGKYNMSADSASKVSTNIIPNVINDMVSKTRSNEPENDAFDLNDLIGSLTGGKSSQAGGNGFNFQDLISKFTGGGGGQQNETGGFDLQDIISQVTRGAQEKKVEEKSSGGISDMIKGFFN